MKTITLQPDARSPCAYTRMQLLCKHAVYMRVIDFLLQWHRTAV
jgi:hypothetical protein